MVDFFMSLRYAFIPSLLDSFFANYPNLCCRINFANGLLVSRKCIRSISYQYTSVAKIARLCLVTNACNMHALQKLCSLPDMKAGENFRKHDGKLMLTMTTAGVHRDCPR